MCLQPATINAALGYGPLVVESAFQANRPRVAEVTSLAA
jgi:hypothetical protein